MIYKKAETGGKMKISQIFQTVQTPVSFEVFPPKGDLGIETLKNVLDGLKNLRPDFISVTCSAGGSGNSNKTVGLAGMIRNEYGLNSVAHLTCLNSNLREIEIVIAEMKSAGIENILALRGDKVEGKSPADFLHAQDLIEYLNKDAFCIGAACYPEGHIECESMESDILRMKQKQDAGASFFISQLFFDNSYYYRFLEKARAAGITRPVTAGVMPFLSRAQISRMIFLCGASLPSAIIKLLNKYESSPEDLRKAGIDFAARQLFDLLSHGVDGVHIYTMNQPDIAEKQLEFLKRAGYGRN